MLVTGWRIATEGGRADVWEARTAMAIEVSTSTVAGCRVLAIRGAADGDVLTMVADGIAAVVEGLDALVIDVDELLLTDIRAVRGFLARLFDILPAERLSFHCSRHSGRRILRRCGGDDLKVFATMEGCAAAARGCGGLIVVRPRST